MAASWTQIALCALLGHRAKTVTAPKDMVWVAPLRAGAAGVQKEPVERAHKFPDTVPLLTLKVCGACGAWNVPGFTARGTWVRKARSLP